VREQDLDRGHPLPRTSPNRCMKSIVSKKFHEIFGIA
jgi:hypothetical protein